MKIYSVITQGIHNDGYHINGIDNFTSLEKAKAFIDNNVECQKRLEGTDNIIGEFDVTGEANQYGWMYSGKIVYGVKIMQKFENKHCFHEENFQTIRFVLETEAL